jgi:hypothetical protein
MFGGKMSDDIQDENLALPDNLRRFSPEVMHQAHP